MGFKFHLFVETLFILYYRQEHLCLTKYLVQTNVIVITLLIIHHYRFSGQYNFPKPFNHRLVDLAPKFFFLLNQAFDSVFNSVFFVSHANKRSNQSLCHLLSHYSYLLPKAVCLIKETCNQDKIDIQLFKNCNGIFFIHHLTLFTQCSGRSLSPCHYAAISSYPV